MSVWPRIAVVGGINLDILGMPKGRFIPKDSMIGSVVFRPGGVGRNVAAQAARSRADVSLFTVFGSDRWAKWLREACLEDGIRIDHSATVDSPSSVYLAIHDETGDMAAAVNDMALTERFTPDLLEPMLGQINSSNVCVLDTNLPQESLLWLAERLTVPAVVDPVSIAKADRAVPLLPLLTALKPNLAEARYLTGEREPEKCAAVLHKKGLPMAFISMGREGLFYSDGRSSGIIPPHKVSQTPQTGAGDAVTAGVAIGLSRGDDARRCAEMGVECAERHLFQN